MNETLSALADEVFASVNGSVLRNLQPLLARLDAIEKRSVVDQEMLDLAVQKAVDAMPRPKDGVSVDLVSLSSEIVVAAAKAVEAIPKPKDGRDFDPEVLEAAVTRAVGARPVPKDGKDADAEAITGVVLEKVMVALEKIPAPKDGTDGKDFDPELIRLRVAEILPGMVDKAQAVLSERLDAWLEALPKPKDGEDGKDADPALIRSEVERAVAAIPAPENGKDADPEQIIEAVQRAFDAFPKPTNGEDGKTPTPEEVAGVVRAEVTRAVEAIPKPKDGSPGPTPAEVANLVMAEVARAVEAIPKAKDGTPGPSAEEVSSMVRAEVTRAVEALPEPEPGLDGRDADIEVIRSVVLDELVKMPRPKDGKNAEPEFVRAEIERAVALLPPPKDGKDGLSFDQSHVELKDGRTVVFKISNGQREMVHELKFPTLVYREIYKSGGAYDAGDSVTYGGSLWIALRDTKTAPGGESRDWRLAVKKG